MEERRPENLNYRFVTMVQRSWTGLQMRRRIRTVFQSWIWLFLIGVGGGQAFERHEVLEQMREMRPAQLDILLQRPDRGGDYLLGIYEVRKDQMDASLRRYKIWQEWPDDLQITTETVSCDPAQPMRVTRGEQVVFVRHLNPGGSVNLSNREDHLVWWAACVPELAGIDPASLHEKALSLGYSTLLVESEEALNSPMR